MDWSLIAVIAWLLIALGLAVAIRRPGSQRAVLVAVGVLPLVAWVLLRGPSQGEVEGPRPESAGRGPSRAVTLPDDRLEPALPPGEQPDSRALRELELLADSAAPLAPEETLAEKRTPIRLFETAKVIPHYQGDVMLGVSIANLRPGSFWELVGLEHGDVIFESNGQLIDNPEASIELMNSMSQSDAIRIWVRGVDGRERYLVYDLPPEDDGARGR